MKEYQIDQIKGMRKIFSTGIPDEEILINEKDRKIYLSPSNIIGIIPKLEGVKKSIETVFNIKPCQLPCMDYTRDGDNLNSVKLATENIKLILEIVKKTKGEYVTVLVNQDSPITIKTDELDFLIAPYIPFDGSSNSVLTKLTGEIGETVLKLSRLLKKKKIPEHKVKEIIDNIMSLLI